MVGAITLPAAGSAWSARNARAGSETSMSPSPAISKTPTSSVEPKRFFEARTSRSAAYRSPSSAITASTRCSMVFGPGDRAVLGHVPDEYDRDRLALGELHQSERGFADLPEAPGRAVELVDRGGLDRIDDDQRRSHRPADFDDPRHVVVGKNLDRGARRHIEQPQPAGADPDLGRGLLARGIEDGARPRPAAAWRSSVDLPIPGSPPTRTREPGTSPPPRTRSSSAMPVARRGTSDSPMSVSATGVAASVGTWGLRPARGVSRTTVSTRLFHAPQARHWPSQRRKASPQPWQTKRLVGRATDG